MKYVHQNCYDVINEACSIGAHKKLGLDFNKTNQCVTDSFTSTPDKWEDANTNNTIIDEEIEYWRLYGTGIYPAIMINNRAFRG